MKEYIITIEDWFFKHMHERYTHFFGCPIEEIVRCRDCRFSLAYGNGCGKNQDIYDAEPDGFCKWGERK